VRPFSLLISFGVGAGLKGVVRNAQVLANQVNHREQADPDDIDEVPVVRHDDRRGGLAMGESTRYIRAREDEQEGDQTAGYVHSVEAGGQVEDRAESRRRERNPFFHKL